MSLAWVGAYESDMVVDFDTKETVLDSLVANVNVNLDHNKNTHEVEWQEQLDLIS